MTLPGSPTEKLTSRYDRSPDLVRVWRIRLDTFFGEVGAMEKLLSADETARAGRYRFDRDRQRYIVARGALRLLLGRYLQERPEKVVFQYGTCGKPALAPQKSDLRFNVSHSQDIALIAIGSAREIGVDVEFLRPMDDRDSLLTSNFSPREVAAFIKLPPHQREAAFFAGWTRKEAYLKALGGGLSVPLHGFSVSIGPDEPAALLEVPGAPLEVDRWQMVDLPVHAGYAAALVAEGGDWRFDCIDWAP